MFYIPYYFFYFFWGGGAKNPKIVFDQFSRHFRQFLTTLIFSFLTKMFLNVPYFFWGVGGEDNKSKNHFNLFSRHFRQFLTTLIFSVDKFCLHIKIGVTRLKMNKINFGVTPPPPKKYKIWGAYKNLLSKMKKIKVVQNCLK